MASDRSITHWLQQLQQGHDSAAQSLWERYFPRLVALARSRLTGTPHGIADEEDVAISAFTSFCRAVQAGRFARLKGASDLWAILVRITLRKAADLRGSENRQKRGLGVSRVEAKLDTLVGKGVSPESTTMAVEEYGRLLNLLKDDELREIARWKMEGYKDKEVAQRLGCDTRTVERKLRHIRKVWGSEK